MPRTTLPRTAVAVALCLVVVAVPLPAWASQRAVSPQVASAFERWESSVPAVRRAAREVAAAERALEPARLAVAAAAKARDDAVAGLRGHDDEIKQAEARIGEALERARQAGARLTDAEAHVEAADEALQARSSQLRVAGETAAAPDVREESHIRQRHGHALVSRAAAQQESVAAEHAARLTDVRQAKRKREAAEGRRQALEAALQRTREALDEAQAEHDERARDVEDRREALAARQAEHDAAIAGMRGLGWRAGVLGRGGLVWPTDGSPGSRFGMRRHPITRRVRLHAGVDVPAPRGQTVVATAAGTVTFAARRGGYGFLVEMAHGSGRTSRYAHLSYISVRVGERVGQAQRIGKIGSTGASTGPHLHFEVRVHDQPQDPLNWFSGAIRG